MDTDPPPLWHLSREKELTGSVRQASGLCRGADKSLARPTSRCILFDGENISFDVSIVIYTGCPGGNVPDSGECSLS